MFKSIIKQLFSKQRKIITTRNPWKYRHHNKETLKIPPSQQGNPENTAITTRKPLKCL